MKETLTRILTLGSLLYLFFIGLELMQLAFKLFGKGFAERLIETTSNPFLGLFIGVLATSLVQSSSSTTSMTVAMVSAGVLTLLLGIGLLFLALRNLVVFLRKFLSGKAEAVLHRTLFRSAPAAILAGLVITVMVQSSSITTSVLVPIIAAGVVTLEQAFPFTVGANIGTTVTALVASLALGSPAAPAVACAHLLFNLCGAVLIYGLPPVRRVPLALARWTGRLAVRSRPLALAYILITFFGIPLLLLLLTGGLDVKTPPDPPIGGSPAEQTAAPSREEPDSQFHGGSTDAGTMVR